MSEIILGDVLSWHGECIELLTPGEDSAILNRTVSWAESIRAAMPVLPRLRGDEIVIIPSKTLGEFEAAENVSWSVISSMLRVQPIAAVLVDGGRKLDWPSQIPVLIASPQFIANAETDINRIITERRSELFRVGSDLARAMSVLSLSGAGVTPVLNVAEKISGVAQMLFDSRQRIVSNSPHARQRPLEDMFTEPLLAAGRETGFTLACRADGTASADICRLVLSQTSQQLGMLIDRGTIELPVGSSPRDASRVLRNLLTGAYTDAAGNGDIGSLRDRLNNQELRVALIISARDRLAKRIGRYLPTNLLQHSAVLEHGEFAFIIPAGDRNHQLVQLRKGFDRLHGDDETAFMAMSDSASDVDSLPGRYQEAKALARLAQSGIWDKAVIDSDDIFGIGVEGVFYHYWRHNDGTLLDVRQQLLAFSGQVLEKLTNRDKRHGSDLVGTLSAYLKTGGMVSATAKSLGIHRNTVAYRLNLIQTVAGHDINDTETQVLYRIAFAVRNLEHVLR